MINTIDKYVYDMTKVKYNSREEYDKKSKACRKRYKMVTTKTDVIKTYNKLVYYSTIQHNQTFYQYS